LAIARALALARILILDEAFSALDFRTRRCNLLLDYRSGGSFGQTRDSFISMIRNGGAIADEIVVMQNAASSKRAYAKNHRDTGARATRDCLAQWRRV